MSSGSWDRDAARGIPMKTAVLVVATNDHTRKKFLEAAAATWAESHGAASLDEMHALLLREPFNGILIDIHTALTASDDKKRLLNLIENTYPVAKARLDPKGSVVVFGGKKIGGDALRTFVEQRCEPFRGRKIRADERIVVHFNILLSLNTSMKNSVRTVTADVSRTGCFVFLDDPPPTGSTVWLRFAEIDGHAPAESMVARSIPWGSRPMQISGAGLFFVTLPDGLLKEIGKKLPKGMKS